jgi:hypothetical protein
MRHAAFWIDPEVRNQKRGAWDFALSKVPRGAPLGFVKSTSGNLAWFIWRAPIHLYLFTFAVIVACMRARSWRYAVLGVPVWIHSIALVLTIPSSEFRYVWPILATNLLFFSVASVHKPGHESCRRDRMPTQLSLLGPKRDLIASKLRSLWPR